MGRGEVMPDFCEASCGLGAEGEGRGASQFASLPLNPSPSFWGGLGEISRLAEDNGRSDQYELGRANSLSISGAQFKLDNNSQLFP